MFNETYVFKGKHANQVVALKNIYDEKNKLKIFNRSLDIYLIAPIIGFIYNKKAGVDKTLSLETKIFSSELLKIEEDIKYTYQVIMLSDKHYEPNLEKRIDKAFRYIGTEKAKEDFELFNSYVRGGIEILYEKLLENVSSNEDYIDRVVLFLDEFNAVYNKEIDTDSLLYLLSENKI